MTFPEGFNERRFAPQTWYWCSLACQSVYADGATWRDSIMNWPGPCTWEYLHDDNIVAPDWILADYGDAAAVVLRGTRFDSLELLHEAANLLLPVSHPLVNGRTWGYFGLAALDIWEVLESKLTQLNGWQRMIFTGHSWGGAVAMVLSQMYKNKWHRNPLATVTFGAPKAGNGAFAAGCTWPIFRIENLFDPVPFLPSPKMFRLPPSLEIPLNVLGHYFVHPGTAWIFDAAGELVQVPGFDEREWRRTPRPLTTREIWQQFELMHQIAIYTQRMRAQIGYLDPGEAVYPDLHPLHKIAGEMMNTQGFSWPFDTPLPRGGPAAPPNYVPTALAAAMKNVCHGPCCRDV